MIKKEDFCNALENLRIQMNDDKKNAQFMNEAFGSTDALYDNSRLIATIIDLLELHFPKESDGYSELSFYIFDQRFGKPSSDSEWETPEQLYERLTK